MEKVLESTYSVYIHTCPNNKVYIGITRVKPEKRWKSGSGYFNSRYFYSAIKKYGWKNIKHEILFKNLTKEQAEQKEIELIAFYKSSQRQYGYNIENGGKCFSGRYTEETLEKMRQNSKGRVVSQETREKISKALKGRVFSEETKKKISLAKTGVRISEETKQKLREYNTGRKWTLEQRLAMSNKKKGVKFTESHRKKMSEYAKNRTKEHLKNLSIANSGKKKPIEEIIKNSVPIVQYSLDGEIIKEFWGIHQAYYETQIPYRQIHACCSGRQKTAHGYIWKYKNPRKNEKT